jgi:hypothetical protein
MLTMKPLFLAGTLSSEGEDRKSLSLDDGCDNNLKNVGTQCLGNNNQQNLLISTVAKVVFTFCQQTPSRAHIQTHYTLVPLAGQLQDHRCVECTGRHCDALVGRCSCADMQFPRGAAGII